MAEHLPGTRQGTDNQFPVDERNRHIWSGKAPSSHQEWEKPDQHRSYISGEFTQPLLSTRQRHLVTHQPIRWVQCFRHMTFKPPSDLLSVDLK